MTFVIPFCLDTPARLTNLETLLDFLMIRFDTSVIVSELDQEPRLNLDVTRSEFRGKVRHSFHVNHSRFFSRSRSVNLGSREVETPYLAINDADALVQTCQYLDAVALLREGVCDMALPYANRVMWIPPDDVVHLQLGLSDERLGGLDYKQSDDGYIFLGLVGLLKKDAFRCVGMMNERFRSWGFEEMELYIRLLKLGFRVLRTSGRAYHLGHPDGGNSSSEHPHFLDNRREYHKVLSLNPADLRQYVNSWPWAATTRD
ncbi:MAG: galactosyltransferase-related protein [Chloroflexota bacterium]|nr:galactosyltransferase-related protein [Chloroflexota bacterium]